MKQLISHDELLEYCNYNQKTGVFILKRNGARIGHYDKNNEKRTMHINGKKYQEARLAVFYATGKWAGELCQEHKQNSAVQHQTQVSGL